jgi:hypothetical protein
MAKPHEARRVAYLFARTAIIAVALSVPTVSLAVVTAVTTAQVSVRQSPNGAVVGVLKPGTVVAVLKVAGEVTQIMYFPKPGAKEVKTGWIATRYLRVVSRGGTAGGDDCETEYKTGAEVCVTVTDAELDCTKDFSGEYYRSCEVTIEYDVRTNYSGGSYLDVDVECEVEITYTGREMYSSRSDSESNNESHNLYANGSESESMSFDFSFSSFNEVTRVRIESSN